MRSQRLTIALLLFSCSSSSQSGDLTIPLPTSTQLEFQVRTDKSLEATLSLYKKDFLEPNELTWLYSRAFQGIPPLQYELSRRIHQGLLPGSSVEWFAKGYVLRSLDAAECSKGTLNPGDMVLRTLYAPLHDLALKNPSVYADELERAIEWEAKRSNRASSKWICGDLVMQSDVRQLARTKQLEEIRQGIIRLRAKHPSDE